MSDAIWEGMPEFRAVLEKHISQAELRACWSAVNPISYFEQYARFPKKSLLIRARYDTTFTPQYSNEAIQPFRALGLDHQVVELACGHHTIGDLPYALIDCYHVCAFIKKRLV